MLQKKQAFWICGLPLNWGSTQVGMFYTAIYGKWYSVPVNNFCNGFQKH